MMRRKLRGALGAITAGIILIAGQAAPGRAALSYDITLGAGAVMNDNLHLDPRTSGEEVGAGEAGLRQPVKEMIYTINPGVTVSWSARHDRLQLDYSGEYSMYQGDEERDPMWVHDIAADLEWRRWSPFFLEAQEERSRVPRTQEREGEAYVDQVDRNLLSVRTGLFSEISSRSTIELAYRGELNTYSVIGAAVPVEEGTDSGSEALDRVERHFGDALVRHRWSPLWEGEARLSYGQVDRELASDYAELIVSAAVDQRWSEHLTLRYNLEWRREEDDKTTETSETPVDPVRSNLLLAVEIKGDLARGGSWNLAYADGLEDQSDGDTLKTGRTSAAATMKARLGSALTVGGWHETRDYRISGREETAWGPTLGVRWLIRPWSALDMVGGWTNTTIREEGLDEVEDRTLRAAAGVVLMLFKRLQLEAGYGYRKNSSTDALRSYSNNLVFALLTFHFRPVEAGRLPSSYASSLIRGGTPSGGSAQAAEGGAEDSVP